MRSRFRGKPPPSSSSAVVGMSDPLNLRLAAALNRYSPSQPESEERALQVLRSPQVANFRLPIAKGLFPVLPKTFPLIFTQTAKTPDTRFQPSKL